MTYLKYALFVPLILAFQAPHALEVAVGGNGNQIRNLQQGLKMNGLLTELDTVNVALTAMQAEIEELKNRQPRQVEVGTVVKPASQRYTAQTVDVNFDIPFEERPEVFVQTQETASGGCRGFGVGIAVATVSRIRKTGFRLTMPGSNGGCLRADASRVTWTALEPQVERVGCRARATITWGASCRASLPAMSHNAVRSVTDPNTTSYSSGDSHGTSEWTCNDGNLIQTGGGCTVSHRICTGGTEWNGRTCQERRTGDDR